jgi:hypothetical protein
MKFLVLAAALALGQPLEKIEEKVKEDVAIIYGDTTRTPGTVQAGKKPRQAVKKRKVEPGSAWEVYKDDKLVLRLFNTPGVIVSRAMPATGSALPRSEFLSGSAQEPAEENRLRQELEKSKSTAQFLDRLEKAGYDVRPAR